MVVVDGLVRVGDHAGRRRDDESRDISSGGGAVGFEGEQVIPAADDRRGDGGLG